VLTLAWQINGNPLYSVRIAETIAWTLDEMVVPGGGLAATLDADSEGEEGRFYVWQEVEIDAVLADDADIFKAAYDVTLHGNWEGKTILNRSAKPELGDSAYEDRLKNCRAKLLQQRTHRVRPGWDDKVLADWNGLMIAALAKAGNVLDNPKYNAAAAKGADFILQNLTDDQGRLLKRYRKGKAGLSAHLNDYAFMVWGLLELYQATFEIKYLQDAIELNEQMLSHFWDEKNGGLYMTADDGEKLLVRSKTIYDGAIPSGNSVAVLNLLRLGHMTGRSADLTKAERIIKSFSAEIAQHPAGHSQLMVALEFALNPNYEVVIVGKPQEKDTTMMLAALGKPFLPEKVVIFRPADKHASKDITDIAPFTLPMAAKNGQATAYVCQEFACKLPTTSIDQMLKNLRQN
jgi:uncharacterized protein YyaL (SSP411 family)